jgi:hypothetical protein
MYANAAHIKYGRTRGHRVLRSQTCPLQKYCDAFCQMFEVPTSARHLSVKVARPATTYKEYCESINVIARSAREHSKAFWCCIQRSPGREQANPRKRNSAGSLLHALLRLQGPAVLDLAGYNRVPSLVSMQQRQNAGTIRDGFKEIALVSDAFTRYTIWAR